MTGPRVELDTDRFRADMRELSAGVDRVARDAPRDTAEAVVRELRGTLPRRTGRLAGSVHTVTEGASTTGVSYGAGLPYASYIANRTGAVDDALTGADRDFRDACQDGMAREVSQI